MVDLDTRLRQRLAPVPDNYASTTLRLAAVVCPLLHQVGHDHVVLVEKQPHLRQHAGQIAFPGGMREGSELPAATARRECAEELGLPEAALSLLGGLGQRPSSSGILVHALVGRLDRPPATPDAAEVARLHSVPLAWLRDPGRWREGPNPTGRGQPGPQFELEGALLWGLTARFLRDLLALLD
jgi:8-oxo-dGTP pyrophosphatase MutT (NUDIX family)